jgi:RNA-directed DNA polymerase
VGLIPRDADPSPRPFHVAGFHPGLGPVGPGWLDHFVKEALRRRGFVRYMDDFVVWGDDRRALGEARDQVRDFLGRDLGLALKPDPYINRCAQGMDFLGCRVFPTHRTLNRRSRLRFRRKVYQLECAYLEGQIDERTLQHRVTALVAFARSAGVASWRWRDRVLRSSLARDQGLEPGAPGREREQQRQELPVGEPQQEHA